MLTGSSGTTSGSGSRGGGAGAVSVSSSTDSLAGPEFPAGSIREKAGSVQLILPAAHPSYLKVISSFANVATGRQLISLVRNSIAASSIREPSCRSEITKSNLPSISVISGASHCDVGAMVSLVSSRTAGSEGPRLPIGSLTTFDARVTVMSPSSQSLRLSLSFTSTTDAQPVTRMSPEDTPEWISLPTKSIR